MVYEVLLYRVIFFAYAEGLEKYIDGKNIQDK